MEWRCCSLWKRWEEATNLETGQLTAKVPLWWFSISPVWYDYLKLERLSSYSTYYYDNSSFLVPSLFNTKCVCVCVSRQMNNKALKSLRFCRNRLKSCRNRTNSRTMNAWQNLLEPFEGHSYVVMHGRQSYALIIYSDARLRKQTVLPVCTV